MRRLNDFVPDNHPLRLVRKMGKLALTNIELLLSGTKFIAPIRPAMVRWLKRVDQLFVLTTGAYNLTRMCTLEQIRLQAT